jgi:predicted transcriptional regulator
MFRPAQEAYLTGPWFTQAAGGLPVYDSVLSGDIQQFLERNVHSIEQLEILLLLRASPDREWTVREVYQRVLTNETSVAQSLGKLSEHGLVRKADESAFQFETSPNTEKILEELAQLYKEKPTRILYALYGAQRPELEAFTQAFRVRKPK